MAAEPVVYALAKTATARRLAAPAAVAAALPNVLIASEGPFPVGYVPDRACQHESHLADGV
jgi:hypothetical protein